METIVVWNPLDDPSNATHLYTSWRIMRRMSVQELTGNTIDRSEHLDVNAGLGPTSIE